jgi:hypothetical protein
MARSLSRESGASASVAAARSAVTTRQQLLQRAANEATSLPSTTTGDDVWFMATALRRSKSSHTGRCHRHLRKPSKKSRQCLPLSVMFGFNPSQISPQKART